MSKKQRSKGPKGRQPKGGGRKGFHKTENSLKNIIGVLNLRGGGYGFVTPRKKEETGGRDVFVPASEVGLAGNRDLVRVQITSPGYGTKAPEGRVIKVLQKGNDQEGMLKVYQVRDEFSAEVEQEAALAALTGEDELKALEQQWAEGRPALGNGDGPERQDIRAHQIVTIDGADAKDLDDAVSLERTPGGGYRLGVHIADVSYFVKEGSHLDYEAFERGCSLYFPDRSIPMLPRVLSNGCCSLNPQEDKLTLSCVMEFDRYGKRQSYEIFPSVIRTAERLTYEDINALLEDEDETQLQRYEAIAPMLRNMEKLAALLRKKRIKRGALDFELPESKITLDETGFPVTVAPEERGTANRMIEEFMLAANEAVAEEFEKKNIPFIYRIHEKPAPEKLEELNQFLGTFGYSLRAGKDVTPAAVAALLQETEGREEERVIHTVTLRSMQKAAYSPESKGHFGLAARYYCHFTSPIRRYPDLVIHRIIHEVLEGPLSAERKEELAAFAEAAAVRSSIMERKAEEIERSVEKFHKARWMSKHLGETFDGIISGVVSAGFFVELPNTVEGFVRVTDLRWDWFRFEPEHYRLVGQDTETVYRVGDPVRVKVHFVDPDLWEVRFTLCR